MRALVLDEKVEDEIQRVKRYAEANPVSTRQLVMMAEGVEPPVGDNPNFRLKIPRGFKVAYSLEHQPNAGLCQHMSVSIPDSNNVPHPLAMEMIAEKFEFPPLEECHLWFEDIDGGGKAVNVLAPMEKT
jgi:hypothetical protein